MRFIHQGILLGVCALTLAGCSEENPWAGSETRGEGGIRLCLRTNAGVTDAIPVTRAEETLTAPEVSDFGVRLSKTDGSYSKEWTSVDHFAEETSFKTGDYTLEVYYGKIEEESFEKPHFYGTVDVTVLEGHETPVEVTASLANTMVSVEYTDAFMDYFTAYSTTLHSKGHSYVSYPGGESRPVFLHPGEVTLSLDLTDPQGRKLSVEPAVFMAEPRHHYHITLDVNNGNVGSARLSVIFDDSVNQEDVFLDLTDELFTSAPPSVIPQGFASGDEVETLAGEVLTQPCKFSVVARGGMKSATMTIQSTTFHPSFSNEIDLCAATEGEQADLASVGIKAGGFFKNPDKMAFVDVTDLAAHLPAGVHTVSLVVKDQFSRVSDPVSLTFEVIPVNIMVTAAPSEFGSNRGDLTIVYNGSEANMGDDFSFQAMNDHGRWIAAPVISSELSAMTRAIENKTYNVAVTLPESERQAIPVKVLFKGDEVTKVNVPVVTPAYTVAIDPYARKAMLKITPEDASKTSTITEMLKVYIGEELVDSEDVERYPSQGLIRVSGLSGETVYRLTTGLLADQVVTDQKFTTEKAQTLPNNNFSSLTETIRMEKINAGGGYRINGLINGQRQNTSDIVINEPQGWASINAKTCYSGANPVNTWFCVPSTFADGNVVTLRSVAYDHKGTLPSEDSKNAALGVYFSRNAPSSFASKAAGELFLGSYGFNGSESRTDGIAFPSRPEGLSFTYTYNPVNNDEGVVEVKVLDASGAVLVTKTESIKAATDPTVKTFQFGNYAFGSKAASLRICFKSSGRADVPLKDIPTGNNLRDIPSSQPSGNVHISANQYKSLWTGSELTLSRVRLNY